MKGLGARAELGSGCAGAAYGSRSAPGRLRWAATPPSAGSVGFHGALSLTLPCPSLVLVLVLLSWINRPPEGLADAESKFIQALALVPGLVPASSLDLSPSPAESWF